MRVVGRVSLGPGRSIDVEGERGAGQGNAELQVICAAEFSGQLCHLFTADSPIAFDQFAPGKATNWCGHNAGCPFEAADGVRGPPVCLQGDPQQQLSRTFERTGIGDSVQFADGFCGQIEVKKSVGGEQSADGFGGESRSHGRDFLSSERWGRAGRRNAGRLLNQCFGEPDADFGRGAEISTVKPIRQPCRVVIVLMT
ncbi:MAG TPA: hypothetical protein DC058_15445 [Planctomycetaceae bacterium]|nr:hypothetical protein [Planctomycetaceae bacterium]HBC62595.1 hypothetical protein [Planctomycetaceae bacterium]